MDQFSNPAVLTEGGVFVSEHWLRFSEILQDFNPEFELRWIPPANRSDADRSKPYAVVHNPSNGKPPYIVLFAGELDDPRDIMEKLFFGDMRKNGSVISQVDRRNQIHELFEAKKRQEELDQAADQFHFLMTNRSKNYVNWKTPSGEIVKLDSNRRRI